MPLSVAHTEATLAAGMITELSDVGSALDWDATSPEIARAVDRTARLLGDNIAAVTDMDALETVAVWQAWEAACKALAARYDATIGGQSRSRSQMYVHANMQRIAARRASWAFLDEGTLSITPIVYTSNPYRAIEASE